MSKYMELAERLVQRYPHDGSLICPKPEDVIEATQRIAGLEAENKRLRTEMRRHLPILEALEAKPSAWEWYTDGTGIDTLNGYRAALQEPSHE